MNTENGDWMTDRLLDAALARYSDVEPRSGLEGRILANLAERTTQRASAWKRFVWVPVACAAVLAVVAGISLLRGAKHPSEAPAVSTASVPKTQPQTIQPVVEARVVEKPNRHLIRKAHQAPAIAEVPRQTHFPAPTPPTEQELLLMAYLNATPAHELQAVAKDQQQWREEVRKKAEDPTEKPAQERDINHLQLSPLEGGNTESSAPGAR